MALRADRRGGGATPLRPPEGFSFTPFKAMACGSPIVASTVSSVLEVVGKAGLLVDLLDIPPWTTALTQILDNQ